MERKYTQKPWHIAKADSLISIHTGETFEEINGIDPTICGIWMHESSPERPTSEANALLIHASPDLLEALEECLDFMKDIRCYDMAGQDWLDFVQEKARTAIKKATNQQ